MYSLQNLPDSIDSTYRVECELGSGGGGIVYKAWHSRLNKYVVIKADKQGIAADPDSCRNEADALKNVKCMYIPQVFDYLEKDNRSYTIIEYVEGVSFDKLLKENRSFERADLIRWYLQLASALKSIHERGICHRDIKPSNIMLTTEGDAYLIDFNSALVGDNTTRTMSRSPGYASPEQNELFAKLESGRLKFETDNDQTVVEVDEAECVTELSDNDSMLQNPTKPVLQRGIDWKLSDVYSLGAAMYHLLTGKRPLLPADDTVIFANAGYSEDILRYVIDRSLKRDPNLRFPSADELVQILSG